MLVSVSVFHQLVCTIYIACQCIVIYNCFLSLSFLIVLRIYSHIDFCLMFPYSVVLYQCVFHFGGQEGVPVWISFGLVSLSWPFADHVGLTVGPTI